MELKGTERALWLDVLKSIPAVLVTALILAGCSRDEAKPRSIPESAAGSVNADSDENRVEPDATAAMSLLETLADRDEALLEMARVATGRREQLQVSADARRILSEQRKESNRLLGLLKGEYRTTYKPRIAESDQGLIDSLNGVGVGDFDPTFLTIVARHYEEDAQLIDKALTTISPKVREMFSQIRSQRAAEAVELRKQIRPADSRR